MIPKSIKWRLQLWYGLILVFVLAGFGVTAYQLERGRQLGRIDQELHRRIGILANALHRPPRGLNRNRPPPGQPPRREDQDAPPFDGPPQDAFPNPNDGPPILQRSRPLPEFHLPPEAASLFGTNSLNNFFYQITQLNGHGGQEISRSDNFTNLQEPEVVSRFSHYVDQVRQVTRPASSRPVPDQPPTIDFRNNRITGEMLPSGAFIQVGCSVTPELKELHRTAMNLTTVGGLILLVGLAGGGWLVSRAIKPIANISAIAVKISAGDLTQRIKAAETESELGQLAAVLNSTFARLETAFAQQKQFAADAAHELRTPVSVMLTQTQTALNRDRSAPEYRETLAACQRAAQRMRRLTGTLLELARLDAGQEQMKRLDFDLAKTTGDCVQLIRPLAEERCVKILPKLVPMPCSGDPERIAQVITNLLTNAIQYNREHGEVRVSLESQPGMAVLTIADTGHGIAPEDLPRVFERFYRADPARTGAGNAGLGLSICKAIVEAHGGTIEAASEVGVGTMFTVRLPV